MGLLLSWLCNNNYYYNNYNDYYKLRINLQLAIHRLKILINKKTETTVKLRKVIANFVQKGRFLSVFGIYFFLI